MTRQPAQTLDDESLEELYEDAPCGYLTTAPDGTILRANRTLLEWCGYTSADLVGRRRFHDLLPPGARIYYETHYAPLLQMQGHVREIALELVRADGKRLPALVNAVTKADESGRPLLVRVTVFDASERRRYERELLQARGDAETRAAAAGALMHVAEAVVLVDADGVVRVANPAAEQLFGVAGLVGSRLADAAPGWNAVASRIPVAAEPSWVVVPLAIADATRWVAAAAEPEAGGAVYTLRDVTDERRLADMRDEIVATVSHELRTPLAGVLGAAKTLTSREDSLTEETRRALIGMIGEQSARLARIVEEILLTQGLDAGGVELERRTFDVGELVERVVAAAPADGRRIRVDAAQGALAEGDPDRFEQVVLNLLDNAVKYSPPETEIRIAVERERGSVRLTVADNGPGIPPADRERIFDKFVRLDPAHAGGVGGTGLGLSIARELVRRMGGRVGVLDSERGATFCVDLPAAV